jgi:hypothetical protein
MQYLKSYKNKNKKIKKKSASSPPIFFFFNEKKKHKNKNMLYGKEPESKPSMCGKIKHVLREGSSELPR